MKHFIKKDIISKLDCQEAHGVSFEFSGHFSFFEHQKQLVQYLWTCGTLISNLLVGQLVTAIIQLRKSIETGLLLSPFFIELGLQVQSELALGQTTTTTASFEVLTSLQQAQGINRLCKARAKIILNALFPALLYLLYLHSIFINCENTTRTGESYYLIPLFLRQTITTTSKKIEV